MNEMKRQMKMAENKQRYKEIIKQFDGVIRNLDIGIDKCWAKAKEALVERNDMNSFKLFGRSLKYYTNMKNSIEAVKAQFENYYIQMEVANTFVGLKDVLGRTAKMMDTMPSLTRNNKDFMKFKKSVMKGQISMDSINSMMSNLDPSADSELTPSELKALQDEILMQSGAGSVTINDPNQNTQPQQNAANENSSGSDFFKELDI